MDRLSKDSVVQSRKTTLKIRSSSEYCRNEDFIVTNSMEHNSYWEAGQEILRLLWKLNVQYRTHKSSSLVDSLSHINSIHIVTPCLRYILISSALYIFLDLRNGLFASGFSTNIL
jgi:hypothetical protein